MCALVFQLCLILWEMATHFSILAWRIMDCSPPGSSVHGILQARILKWVAISFSKGTSQPSYQTWVSSIAGRFFTIWAVLDNLRPPLYLRAHGNYSDEPVSTLPALATLPSPFLLMQSMSFVKAHPWFLCPSDWGSVLSSLLYWVLPCVALLGVLCLLLPGTCEYNLFPHDSHFRVCVCHHIWLEQILVHCETACYQISPLPALFILIITDII